MICAMQAFWTFMLYVLMSNILFGAVYTKTDNKLEVIFVKLAFDIAYLASFTLTIQMFGGACA